MGRQQTLTDIVIGRPMFSISAMQAPRENCQQLSSAVTFNYQGMGSKAVYKQKHQYQTAVRSCYNNLHADACNFEIG